MHHRVIAAVVLTQFVNLGVAVVASGNTIIGACCFDLLIFQLAVLQTLFLETRLQKSAAAAATVVVGAVRLHVDEIFLPDHRFDNVAQVFGNGVTEAFADDLTGVLYGELYFEVLVPVGINLEFAFPDPFGVVFVDILYFKIVLEIEFFQSGPD